MIYRPTHPPSYGYTEFRQAIRRCGLSSGLKLCLDAGDGASYSGSGQSWLDTSGNSYHFYRGATSSAEGSDPTFNGVAGRRSSNEYWSFDGGDFFRYSATNAAWMNNLHKNNALFTVAFWVYVGAPGGANANLFGTCDMAVVDGIKIYLNENQTLMVAVWSYAGGVWFASSSSVSLNAWHFIALSLDEANNTAFFYVDQPLAPESATYSSPGTGTGYTMEIGGAGNGLGLLPNGFRLAEVAMWEGRALTPSELTMLHFKTKGRFGL